MTESGIRELVTSVKNGFPTEENWRTFAKKMYRTERGRYSECDRARYSLTEQPRIRYDNYDDEWYGEYWKEYGFFNGCWSDGTPKTDEEIREYIDEYLWERIYSPYDCTGQPFTRWINWHRNPCGLVSYIHYKALDV